MATKQRAKLSRGSIARHAVVWVAALAVAGVTGLLQLDQQVRVAPTLALLVPEPFKSRALTVEVQSRVQMRDATVFDKARTLVLRRPVPAESLALFSLAAAYKGEAATADKAMSAAASRGWRVAIVNLLALQGAYNSKDWESATLRLAALRKLRAAEDFTAQGLALIAKEDAGRLALADYAAKDPYFASFLLHGAIQAMPPQAAVTMLERAKAEGAAMPCGEVAWASRSLVTTGQPALAKHFWTQNCAEEGATDPALDPKRLAEPGISPFDWRFDPQPGLSRSPRGDGILVRNRDPIRRPFAVRLTTLSPGTYALAPMAKAASKRPGSKPATITAEVRCFPKKDGASIRQAGTDTILTVTAACPAQEITLLVERGEAVVTGFEARPLR